VNKLQFRNTLTMESAEDGNDFVDFGNGDESFGHVYEWLDSDETDEYIDRVIIETLAEIKIWQYRQNPRIPLRQVVLNRNLYNSVCGAFDL